MRVNKHIYTLSCPISNKVVYVGTTQDLNQRLQSHYHYPSKALRGFIEGLRSKNLMPKIEAVDMLYDNAELKSTEIFWIQTFQCWGFDLLNINGKIRVPSNKKFATRIPGGGLPIKVKPSVNSLWARNLTFNDAAILGRRYGIGPDRICKILIQRVCTKREFSLINDYLNDKAA